MNKHEIGGEPQLVRVAELTWPEALESSGIYDEEQGRDLTNLEAIEVIEKALGAQDVILNSNGHRSPEVQQKMSELSRKKELTADNIVLAVLSKRPPKNG